MRFIDMHLHTTASDGSCTPSAVCQLAIDKGLAAIAITDHDTVDGVAEAISYVDDRITVVPGIEMSAVYHGVEIHILGFYMDYTNPKLISSLASIKQGRYNRTRKCVPVSEPTE